MNNYKHSLFIRIVALLLLSIFPTTLLAGEVLYYHTDNFGTPMAMTDKNGKVVWRADELPFGEEYETQETPERNNRRFLGKQLDKETGLVSMGARYLDPKTGRFTQPDPVGLVDPATGKVNQEMLLNPQRLNRYVYALNNPYKYVDPEGNSAKRIEDNPANPYEMTEGGGSGRYGGYTGGEFRFRDFFKTAPKKYPRDFQTRKTVQRSAQFESEGAAKALAREKLGKKPVKIGDNKLRSQNGKWQYRAKPVDTENNHIHLERLNPRTGEIIENWHLKYHRKR